MPSYTNKTQLSKQSIMTYSKQFTDGTTSWVGEYGEIQLLPTFQNGEKYIAFVDGVDENIGTFKTLGSAKEAIEALT